MASTAGNIIGPHVRCIRVANGATQADLAGTLQRSGWDASREIVAQIEGGARCVTATELAFLATALAVEVANLLPRATIDAFLRSAIGKSGRSRSLSNQTTKERRSFSVSIRYSLR